MKIISLTSENIKRLKAVELRPDGKSLVIAGRNAQGKSSVLDSIVYALAGKAGVCERPIRDGESHAEITIDLDEFVVTRTFTAAGGGTLKVVPKGEKAGAASPQAILDRLIGSLTFDPLGFSRQKESEQAATLRALVGLDFSDLDARKSSDYAARLLGGREVDALKGKVAGQVVDESLPAAPIEISAVVAARRQAEATNAENQKHRDALARIVQDGRTVEAAINKTAKQIDDLQRQIQTLQSEIQIHRDRHSFLSGEYLRLKPATDALVDTDLKVFDAQLIDASTKNEAIRKNAELRETRYTLAEKLKTYAGLTAALDSIESERTDRLAKAKFPLPGLSISSAGTVTYNSIPFSQLSSAEQLKVSASIALALNPKLRVMLIRDGSLLDADSLETLKQLAAASDAQLWIEKVGSLGSELPGVVIEDGNVSTSTL